MKKLLTPLLSISIFLIGNSVAQENNQPPEGFTAIFNGKDLTGWYANNPHKKDSLEDQAKDFAEHWTVENGELVNDGHGAYATTEKEYGDIEFHIEYKTVARADSGIYLRGTPQVQIWDHTDPAKFKNDADKGSGGLWNNSKGAPGKNPSEVADRPFGEWNSFKIKQIGARTWVTLNGKQIVNGAIMENYWDKERKKPLPAVGPIHLQTHGGEIRWRNIFIREIPAKEANATLAKLSAGKEFKSIFNGKDLSGWKGATENYEVTNGAIGCKDKHGGVLFHEDELGDFIARLEFKVPPGGNNGLAIRYPGEGDAAYGGMCELQVLDNTAEKYAKLDERQYHGSAYAMAPAARGYNRPVGEWNYQEVTVKGSTIKVELNGSVILNTDLSTITEFMKDRPHPGKDRKSGYFGFAGHNDPVLFRNLSIKKL